MRTLDLRTLSYHAAWAEQERVHAEVVAGASEAILLVEHPPVITMGRRGETLGVTNLTATPQQLAERGVEFVQTDRGGDITFHGLGQLVVYPIIRLIDHRLSVGGYVKLLQQVVIQTLGDFGVEASTDEAGIGVWVRIPSRPAGASEMAKICALGVRVKQGTTLHGLALNVSTDLSFYDLIVPCGIGDRPVTSLRQILGERCPALPAVKDTLVANLTGALLSRSKSG